MYVCICKAVTESRVRQAIHEGASDLDQLRAALGVATGCGGCASHVECLVESSRTRPRNGEETMASGPAPPPPLSEWSPLPAAE